MNTQLLKPIFALTISHLILTILCYELGAHNTDIPVASITMVQGTQMHLDDPDLSQNKVAITTLTAGV